MKSRRILLTFAALAATTVSAPAQEQNLPQLHRHEDYVNEVMRTTKLAVDDTMAVFAFVFNSLPERVKVYPTENYYYFTFIHNGKSYDGNIRLDASTRDQGKVDFGYSEDLQEWLGETPVMHELLDASKGVVVEKVEPLVYRITYAGKSVVFELNDLSQVKPPANALGPNETFIGPIFDDSAIRFFLVYNSKLKIFHYILDETVKEPEEFVPTRRSDRILIGKRTGFAFYRDDQRDRKILIGVFEGNVRVNNYFDGPFDQLPDNFIEGETLRDILLQVEPSLKGKIDRWGGSPDGSVRFAIDPYLAYRSEEELEKFYRCAVKELHSPNYYNCFVVDYDKDGRPHQRSRALAKRPGKPNQRHAKE